MKVFQGTDTLFMNASLPAPNKLRSYLVLRDAVGNPVGMIIDPNLSADDVECLLGLNVETIFVEPTNPVTDIVTRIAGL